MSEQSRDPIDLMILQAKRAIVRYLRETNVFQIKKDSYGHTPKSGKVSSRERLIDYLIKRVGFPELPEQASSHLEHIESVLREWVQVLPEFQQHTEGTPPTKFENPLAVGIHPPLDIAIDPGTAPPEVIADILSDLSLIYRLRGGSGISFKFEEFHSPVVEVL